MSDMPERVWVLPMSRTWVTFPTDKGTPYVPASRLAALEAERDEWKADTLKIDENRQEMQRRYEAGLKEIVALRAERDALVKALEEYGAHDFGCPKSLFNEDWEDQRPCSCGLDAARAVLARKEGT